MRRIVLWLLMVGLSYAGEGRWLVGGGYATHTGTSTFGYGASTLSNALSSISYPAMISYQNNHLSYDFTYVMTNLTTQIDEEDVSNGYQSLGVGLSYYLWHSTFLNPFLTYGVDYALLSDSGGMLHGVQNRLGAGLAMNIWVFELTYLYTYFYTYWFYPSEGVALDAQSMGHWVMLRYGVRF